MAFDVTFTDTVDSRLVAANGEATGTIVIGDFKETFFADLDILSKHDYLAQWLKAAQRLQEGHGDSAIITSFADRGGAVIGMWWPLYVCETGLIAVQNRMILREIVGPHFSVASCYDHIGPHNTTNENDERISEWNTTFDDLAAFAVRVRGKLAEGE
jgi:hypothetical protein